MSIADKISDYIGLEKILTFIEQLFEFYFKPLKFFKEFFELSLKDKIIQTVFYSLIVLGIGYVLIEDVTIRQLLKVLLYEISLLFKICIVLILSDLIISRIKKQKSNSKNIIFFVILVKLLIAPFQVIFFGLFITNENYNFLFFENLVLLGLFFYMIFFSARVFNKKLKYIFVNIILNIVFLNIFIFVTNKLSIDEYSRLENQSYKDEILKERIDKGKLISEYFNIPSHRVLYKFDDNTNISHFLFLEPFDSISSGSFEESERYLIKIEKNISILDTMCHNLDFERNKEFFSKTLVLYKTIDSIMKENVVNYTVDDIERFVVCMNSDSIESHKEITIKTPNKLYEMNYSLLSNQFDLEKKSYYSSLPILIIKYFFPIDLLEENKKKTP